jgi:hypothetical protein
MSNSPAFREAMAIAATNQATYCNLHTGDPGTTGANESTGARGGPIVWTAGAVDGTVQGAELTLANVPAGNYPYASLFGGATGANFLTSYQLPAPVSVGGPGPVKVTPQYVHPAG